MLITLFRTPFLWIMALPLFVSPLVYLVGRWSQVTASGQKAIATHPAVTAHHNTFPRRAALLILGLTWIPYIMTIQQFIQKGETIVFIERISLRLDGISLLVAGTVLTLGTLVVIFSGPYMAGENGEEKYYAMLLAMIGVMIALGCAGDLFNLWVWFEAMAVSSYLLVMFYREQPASLEAGIKYVVQSASGSVLVLMGIAIVLAQTGTLNLAEIQKSAEATPALLAAGALFVVGFGVKTALAPMHTWLPDAHTQAPSGISAMLSGVVIEAGLVAMLRALAPLSAGYPAATWGALLMGFGIANMFTGNLMALRQIQVKRLLAYSSLSHIGYMVLGLGIALYAGQLAGAQGSLFHLINHALMKGLAFLAAGAILFAVDQMGARETSGAHTAHSHGPLTIPDLNGAAQRYPLAALAFSLAVLGLGGLPPLAGFMSKWQIFVAGFASQNLVIGTLVIIAALNSVLSLAYYAPLVNSVYRKKPSPAIQHGGQVPLEMNITLGLLALAVIALGIWPGLVEWLTSPAAQVLMASFGGS